MMDTDMGAIPIEWELIVIHDCMIVMGWCFELQAERRLPVVTMGASISKKGGGE